VADPDELARAAVARLGRYGPGDERTGTAAAPDSWLSCWNRAERAAQSAIDKILSEDGEVTEPGVARELFSILPERSTLVVSSSMPVRDIEWYSRPRPSAPRVLANRGANGIDGVTSTVLGVASAIGNDAVFPVVGLIGDLAFLHDVSALVWGAAEKRPSAILVVIDNAGGGIFNFLPYATSLDEATFERGFGTPQVCDLAGVALAFGCSVVVVEQISELAGAIAAASSEGGLVVVLVRSERGANVALHDRLNAAIASAVDSALS
jgi:2-succinyl-5-enolpyruvyl-6-hydroxy-3-cyclohexene-1-carboxylate synthase